MIVKLVELFHSKFKLCCVFHNFYNIFISPVVHEHSASLLVSNLPYSRMTCALTHLYTSIHSLYTYVYIYTTGLANIHGCNQIDSCTVSRVVRVEATSLSHAEFED